MEVVEWSATFVVLVLVLIFDLVHCPNTRFSNSKANNYLEPTWNHTILKTHPSFGLLPEELSIELRRFR
jgi:hypothetical protein